MQPLLEAWTGSSPAGRCANASHACPGAALVRIHPELRLRVGPLAPGPHQSLPSLPVCLAVSDSAPGGEGALMLLISGVLEGWEPGRGQAKLILPPTTNSHRRFLPAKNCNFL